MEEKRVLAFGQVAPGESKSRATAALWLCDFSSCCCCRCCSPAPKIVACLHPERLNVRLNRSLIAAISAARCHQQDAFAASVDVPLAERGAASEKVWHDRQPTDVHRYLQRSATSSVTQLADGSHA